MLSQSWTSDNYRLQERERATTIAIAIVGRAITLERKPSKKKQRTDTKKDAKRIKSDKFTRSNREQSNKGAPHRRKKSVYCIF